MEQLTDVEARALGCLIEKHLTTPQYYPLTMNALVNACNQTSNRFPVMQLDEPSVHTAIRTLRDKGLARAVHAPGDRVAKFKHVADEAFELERAQVALLGVLLLRGAQTPGELRARTERMFDAESVEEIERHLDALCARTDPLVVKLERQPGQKEARYAHLLAGEPPEVPVMAGEPPATSPRAAVRDERLGALEAEIAELRGEVASLREIVDALRAMVSGVAE